MIWEHFDDVVTLVCVVFIGIYICISAWRS